MQLSNRATANPAGSLGSLGSQSWGKTAIQVGWTGKAIVYAVLAFLALQIALGQSSAQADQQGALAVVAASSYGTVLIFLLGLALLTYAAANAAEAAKLIGPPSVRSSAVQRGGRGLSALAHAALGVSALSFVLTIGKAAGGGGAESTTATVMSWPGGRILVGVAALTIAAVGVYFIVKEAIKRGYLKTLDLSSVSSSTRLWVDRTSVVGLVARGVAFVGFGVFLLAAALTFNPQQAKGLDELLHSLARTSAGPWLLGLAALGLLAYSAYCLVQAKWRRV